MIRNVILSIIVATVPAFFIGVYLMSLHQRIVTLRRRLEQAGRQVEDGLAARLDLLRDLLADASFVLSDQFTLTAKINALRKRAASTQSETTAPISFRYPSRERIEIECALTEAIAELLQIGSAHPQWTQSISLQNVRNAEAQLGQLQSEFNRAARNYRAHGGSFPARWMPGSMGIPSTIVLWPESTPTTAADVRR